MLGNKIIVHALIKVGDKFLVVKRSETENVYPNFYDLPGGMVLDGELPKDAVVRETFEEINLKIKDFSIIHEDSNLDKVKDKIFIRLVYIASLDDDFENIALDKSEHTEYKLISSLKDLKGEKIVPYLSVIHKVNVSKHIFKKVIN